LLQEEMDLLGLPNYSPHEVESAIIIITRIIKECALEEADTGKSQKKDLKNDIFLLMVAMQNAQQTIAKWSVVAGTKPHDLIGLVKFYETLEEE